MLERNRTSSRRPLNLESLEPRWTLSATLFLSGTQVIGLATDADDNIYLNYLDPDLLTPPNGILVQGVDLAGQETMAPVFTALGDLTAPGHLVTLRSGAHLGLQPGDLLNSFPDGSIVALRPSTRETRFLANLAALAVPVDTSSVYDIQSGISFNFGGTIIPAFASYGDIAVYETAAYTDLFVSGRYAHQFIMRLRVVDQQITQAKVIVSSTASNHRGEGLPPGIAVTKAGMVLTTLGFGPTLPSAGISRPVGFMENFDEIGATPFVSWLTLPSDLIDLAAAGITTDSDDNFVVAQRHGNGDLVVIKQSFSQSFAVNLISSVDLTVNDVALLSDDLLAYVSVGNQIWQVAYPDIPNDSPVVTLRSAAPVFGEGGAPVLLDPQGTVFDRDSSFNGGSLSISVAQNRSDADRLVLMLDSRVTLAGDIVRLDGVDVATILGGAGPFPLLFNFTANSTFATPTEILRRIAFTNLSSAPATAPRTIKVTADDGEGGTSAAKSVTLGVVSVNAAPVLNAALNPSLGSVLEDAAAPAGTRVSSLIAGAVSDADAGALAGIAVTAASNYHGVWQYTLNGGATWIGMAVPTSSAALLLPADASTNVRFIPKLNFNGTVKLYYRAWDQTQGSVGGKLATTGNTGGQKPLSNASENAALIVKPVNDKPVLGLSGSINYVHDAAGVTLAPSAGVTDVDSPDFSGGRLRVRITNGASTSNRLTIGTGFTVDGAGNVRQWTTIIGKRAANGFGTNELIVVFNANATRSVVQQLVRAINFKTVSGAAGQRRVVFTVSDGDGGLSAEAVKMVNVV